MEEQRPNQPHLSQPKTGDDEISLKDIILKIQELWGVVCPHRACIVVISLVIALKAALYTKFIKNPSYTAS